MAEDEVAPHEFIAYRIGREAAPAIVPAPARRAWMDATTEAFANRCLPLLIANQSGWLLLNTHPFTATWTGAADPRGLTVRPDGDVDEAFPVSSHFGHGILTWSVPYLFRTPDGYNLLARGPANAPKDGVAPLEGVVESDWCSATFTMNWKVTRPGAEVAFARDEPFCMIVPMQRGEFARFQPRIEPIAAAPDLELDYRTWQAKRMSFNHRLRRGDPLEASERWQKHYARGTDANGAAAETHETRLRLGSFVSNT